MINFADNLLQPQSDLLGLIQVLVIVFGDDPPVYLPLQAGTTNQTG